MHLEYPRNQLPPELLQLHHLIEKYGADEAGYWLRHQDYPESDIFHPSFWEAMGSWANTQKLEPIIYYDNNGCHILAAAIGKSAQALPLLTLTNAYQELIPIEIAQAASNLWAKYRIFDKKGINQAESISWSYLNNYQHYPQTSPTSRYDRLTLRAKQLTLLGLLGLTSALGWDMMPANTKQTIYNLIPNLSMLLLKPNNLIERIELKPEDKVFIAPYASNFQITQGLHGYNYVDVNNYPDPQMAIDLSAGRGSQIVSPINGTVEAVYVDEYGNPTLIISNKIYRVGLLHLEITVQVGDVLKAGDPVGQESNIGYVVDVAGKRCASGVASCGNHLHLYIRDAQGNNINPFDLMQAPNP